MKKCVVVFDVDGMLSDIFFGFVGLKVKGVMVWDLKEIVLLVVNFVIA